MKGIAEMLLWSLTMEHIFKYIKAQKSPEHFQAN